MPLSPYQTAIALGRPAPGHVKREEDLQRVQAYHTYQEIYDNTSDTWTAVLRDDAGNEISRRLIPTGRAIIEATNRYLCKDPVFTPIPPAVDENGEAVGVDPVAVTSVRAMVDAFIRREELFTKLNSLKRTFLKEGDAVWHILADDTKPEGSRLRLVEEKPETYFALVDPTDPERTIGVYLVSLVEDDEGNPIALRRAYLKTETGQIVSQVAFFEPDGWDDRGPDFDETDLKPVDAPEAWSDSPLLGGVPLDSRITAIPVYLFRNNRRPGALYGLSEMQGLETLFAGIIQTASDQDLTVVLNGVGMYVTTSGPPRTSTGAIMNWIVAPGEVLELEDKEDRFDRVKGVESITPLLDHLNYLNRMARESSGTPDIAVGSVDVKVAESGIALAIQMAPMTAKNEEKETEIKTRAEQMFHDLLYAWFPVYEGLDPAGIEYALTFGDPLPVDRAAVLAEITGMVTAKLIPISYAIELVRSKLGYDIPVDAVAQVMEENAQLLDGGIGARIDEEAGI